MGAGNILVNDTFTSKNRATTRDRNYLVEKNEKTKGGKDESKEIDLHFHLESKSYVQFSS